MEKTTVYLSAELKKALQRAARRRRTSEAALIREGVALVAAESRPPRPRLPLFESGQPGLAARADEALRGFGER
ncbi:MAG: ribbon-helix-helix protein, CopG family [Chloroflexota bacterium]|nr:ribbon-helix-helix protein, CopG family [Chloroflexota bacterium]